jgi:hypothetical protein
MLKEILYNAGYLVTIVLAVIYISDRIRKMIGREFEKYGQVMNEHIERMEEQYKYLSERTSRNHRRMDTLKRELIKKKVIGGEN